ncbi:DUF2066 domain-containing protein [Alkalicaulis satelles]|uniref:DUF2066 domain-containing protein n=1 Tax=Alkalicaulis satelles TaxID=2609175 RepID=A0A5M6ZMV7_9PROT|nr:DUF2066 domain-containing protein [Alkalicaulis satelles]KAA5804578.1 DUF2066 domain-containing protein [Alkalicaulis satelles]
MSLKIGQAVLAALAAAALALFSPAEARSPFTVTGVEIDATADTAFEAQRRAMSDGQVRGAMRLIERLTLPEDRDEAGLHTVSAEDAAAMIGGLRIANEQRSATRYRGVLTLQFDPRAVRSFFAQRGAAFVESQASPVLVVPVMEGESGDSLWRGGWHDAWLEGGHQHALTPFIALGSRQSEAGEPLGRGLISSSEARNLDETALRALARAYEVDSVAVVLARAGGGQVRTAGVIMHFDGADTRREDLASIAGAGDFGEAARRMVQRQEDAFKRRAIVRGGESAELEVTVLFSNLSEWRALQGAVAGAALIENARLDALSRTGAAMMLTHRGARDQVEAELAARGARLERDSELGWTVRSRR